MHVPFSPPDIGEAEIAEVVDTLKSGWITTGPKTKQFEKMLAEFCHTKRAVCLNSATAAAEMTLHLLGVGPGDEVITSAYTYTASASVICHVGAKPILIDTAKNSLEMDYDALENAITEKTKVIIPVDIGGVMCDYQRIFDIVERKKHLFRPSNKIQRAFGRVIVLADAAHALGASQNGKMCGEVADFTTFSFHAVKNLTTGEGGAVTWRPIPGEEDESIYNRYMLFSLHGQSKDALEKTKIGAWEYDIVAPYYKCNMTDIMASLGIAQLKRYPQMLHRRREIYEKYRELLKGQAVWFLEHYAANFSSSGHLCIVRLLGKTLEQRNQVILKMAQEDVCVNVHYKPLPMMTAYKSLGYSIADFPNAYEMFCNEVTLPLHTCLQNDQVEFVAETLKKYL